MQAPILHTIQDQQIWLSAARVMYWENKKILIVSDTHFGKTGHFRKNGIVVPQNVYKEDLQRFFDQYNQFKPAEILVIGDFFHSSANKELDLFIKWRKDIDQLPITLVRGNHDILKDTWYQEANIRIVDGIYTVDNFSFVHDPSAIDDNGQYYFCGHVHPGIVMRNGVCQSLSFPCFFFDQQKCILPAFSKFSGLKMMRPKKSDNVFVITDTHVIKA
ncbi:MAG: ligase-associated DNA damage response endonuclease PdeM [Chitinophagaceae bacterium]|nr:ligase-associated DNA damage response endonuclease PdeM [Chitinophagaceae bacterium]